MRSRLLRRRTVASLGTYVSVVLGLLGTVAASRSFDKHSFGLYATALAAAAFFQTLLDLTVEESLTKYGFAYVTRERWGRLRRLFGQALRLKLIGGLLAALGLLGLAPLSGALFGHGLVGPLIAIAALPLLQAPENVATTALLLRGRYDIRGLFQIVSMGLRLAGIAIGAQYGVTEAMVGIVIAQLVATAAVGAAGTVAFRRFPVSPAEPLGEDRKDIVRFVLQSSAATGMLSLRGALAPLLLGVVAGPTQLGFFRIAQAPQTGFSSVTAPFRLILLAEQTRDWERGRRSDVVRSTLRYSAGAAAVMAVALPVFVWLMPDLIRWVFKPDKLGATDAARIILFAAAIQLVFGWTKSFPVSIGKPKLRIYTHGVETAILLPLVVVFGLAWGATGAAIATLVSTFVFAVVWSGLFLRLREQVASAQAAAFPREALAP
jgi:O-antigen/teichoic acid export membrane protein